MVIHPTARVHPGAAVEEGAELGPGVTVGPFCVIGPEVRLAAGVTLKSHVVVTGDTAIGEDTVVFPFAVLGEIPQDLKYAGEATSLTIGARCRIREHVTVNTGTAGGGGRTVIGDDCLMMAGAHVAHDCRLGDRVIAVNQTGIAGHCVIGDDVILGGLSGVHQFVRIGRGAIVGGLTKVSKDVLPYGFVDAGSGRLEGLNLIGLKRRGAARADIAALQAAYRALAASEGTLADRARALAASDSAAVREVAAFILAESGRSFLMPPA